MIEYKLEVKQIVDYPKCRVYRQFIQSLIADRGIRTNGCSDLFHYAVLCCYANFRTSYQRYDGISYIVHPGQWICPLRELRTWFRARTNRQLLRQLDSLQRHHFIEYDLIGRGQLVQYRILDWPRYNTVLDYSCPCQKDSGFFFLPMSAASRLLNLGKSSEMDALLDLWLNAIYNDHQVAGSEAGPVVYLRNGTSSPLVSYAELGKRWGVSKATAGRILGKFPRMEYITFDNASVLNGDGSFCEMPVLADWYDVLQESTDTRHLAVVLARYVTGSASAMGSRNEIDLDNKYIVIDTSGMPDDLLLPGIFWATDIANDLISSAGGQLSALISDELWSLVGANSNPLAAGYIQEMVKTIRGLGGIAITSTQGMQDLFSLDNGKYGKGILDSSRIKIVMQMEEQEARLIQNVLNLSEEEVRQITRFRRGEGLLCIGYNHVPIAFYATQKEYDAITTSPTDLLNRNIKSETV